MARNFAARKVCAIAAKKIAEAMALKGSALMRPSNLRASPVVLASLYCATGIGKGATAAESDDDASAAVASIVIVKQKTKSLEAKRICEEFIPSILVRALSERASAANGLKAVIAMRPRFSGLFSRMRVLPKLGKEIVKQIEEAWKLPQPDWSRKRLLVVRLIAQHEHTMAEIMKIAGVFRQTVFNYRDKVMAEGVEGLLKRDWAGARVPVVRGSVADEFLKRLEQGEFRQARDAQTWIKKWTSNTLTESGVRQIIRRLGGKLKVPRKSHVKKDTMATEEFRVN
jgi:transposase